VIAGTGGLPTYAALNAYPLERIWPAPDSDDPAVHVLHYEPKGGETTFKVIARHYGGGSFGTLEITLASQTY
jgi:hypothetical protein